MEIKLVNYDDIKRAIKLREEYEARGVAGQCGASPSDLLADFITAMFYGCEYDMAIRTLEDVKTNLRLFSIVSHPFENCTVIEKPLERAENMHERYIKRMEELKKRKNNQ